MKRIYLDYAASTPVDPRVLEAMQPYFSEKFGNPGSLHSFGQEAIAAIDASRETIAKTIGAGFREVIFTGSATEANNLAIRGIAKSVKCQVSSVRNETEGDLKPKTYNLKPRIIISAIEHESVLETARDLERDGAEVIYLPVNRDGIVDLKKIEESLNDRTVLVSVMYANNEIGTIQPVSKISEIVRNFREHIAYRISHIASWDKNDKQYAISNLPLFHTDAAQALQFLDCDVNKLGVDLMTLSAHKIYGPKGVGALYVRQHIANRISPIVNHKPYAISDMLLAPQTTGGGQELGLRSGTENVPLIVGFAKAVELFSNSSLGDTRDLRRELENMRIAGLWDYFWEGLKKICPDAEMNGSFEKNPCRPSFVPCRLPNILNVYFPGTKADELLTKFDLAGLAVSSGSACRSRAVESSYVIESLGRDKERAKNSIRFSFGRPTTKRELDEALEIIKMSIK